LESLSSDGWANVKGRPLINILSVFATGVVFLLAHDYSDHYKNGINIAKALVRTNQEIGPYNAIQVIIENAGNCKETRVVIDDKYPNIFWSSCLVHTLNLLMHDVVKMKDHDHKWIGALYKREENDKTYYQS
jgi:hypothetical protein